MFGILCLNKNRKKKNIKKEKNIKRNKKYNKRKSNRKNKHRRRNYNSQVFIHLISSDKKALSIIKKKYRQIIKIKLLPKKLLKRLYKTIKIKHNN